jgi:selenocysteine-specific translation elongation factor
MANLTVAVLGKLGYSSNFGKKGTTTDITLYNLKKGEDTLTLIEPMRYPDRLAPLFYACSLAKTAIVVVEELNATLGEQLVMLQCCGVNSGYFVLKNYITAQKIQPLVKGTILENYKFVDDDPNLIREELITQTTQIQIPENPQTFGTVPVDHAFNVKGIGAVILGVVVNGAIKIHDTLKVLPGNQSTQVRSIQKHDDNFDSANETDRVGLALKNIKIDEIDRGTVLTNDPEIKTTKTVHAPASLVKYWQIPIKTGMVMHIGHWMQVLNCTVDAVNDQSDQNNPTLTLSLDKEIVHRPNDNAVLMYLEGGKLRVMGTIKL